MTVSDYLRRAAFNGASRPVAGAKMPRETAALVVSLTRIGMDLNAITRVAAASGNLAQTATLDDTLAAIRGVIAGIG